MRKQLKRINQQQKAVKRAQSTIYRASTYGKGKRRKSSASRLGKLGGVSHKSKSVRSAKEKLKFNYTRLKRYSKEILVIKSKLHWIEENQES